MRWWVNSSSYWALQQLHQVCVRTGWLLLWQEVYSHRFLWVSFLNKSTTFLINLHMHTFIYMLSVLQHSDAVQLEHLPAGTWNDFLKSRHYGNLKVELTRFLFLWGLLVWQVANHILCNVFLFTVFWYAQRIACTFCLNEWQVLE